MKIEIEKKKQSGGVGYNGIGMVKGEFEFNADSPTCHQDRKNAHTNTRSSPPHRAREIESEI